MKKIINKFTLVCKIFIRFWQILVAFVNLFWEGFIKLKGNDDNITKKRAILLKNTFENLGSVFIKFGQLLSLRPDFLPREYCKELLYLLDQVPPFHYEEVRKTIVGDLGKPPEKIFKIFKKQPVAAASFGQVHIAYLKTGEKVAVKIQRPKILETVKIDISIIRFFASFLDTFNLGPNKLTGIINEFEKWTYEELDYQTEADYTEKFYEKTKNMKSSDVILSPKIYRKYCSKRVLTAEFIEGFSINTVLLAIKNNDKKFLSKIKRARFSRKKVAETILKNSLRQIYLDGFFHADPHPANIIFDKNKRLFYIDFGIVGNLSRKNRLNCLRYTRSSLYGDSDNAFDALISLCKLEDNINLSEIKMKHDELLLKRLEAIEKIKYGDSRQFIGEILLSSIKLFQKYRIKIPLDTMRYFRTLITVESIVFELYPDIEIEKIARKLRNIAIVNIIKEILSSIKPENFEEKLLSFIGHLEKFFTVID